MTKFLLYFFPILLHLHCVSSVPIMCKGQLCDNNCDTCDLCTTTSCPLTANGTNCYCSSTSIPGNLAVQYTPQFVFLSFRGGLKESFMNQTNFTTTFLGKNSTIVDSIGATMRPSLYITTDELDYNVANWFQQVGILGFQSVSNKVNAQTTSIQMNAEFTKGMQFLSDYGMINTENINLVRHPEMQLADNWYAMLKTKSFTIDSSVIDEPYVYRNTSERMWPYTLDYGVHSQMYCTGDCPTSTYPGMWEFVIPTLYDMTNNSITMDELWLSSLDQSLAIVQKNFMDNYNANRAPFGLMIDIDWLYMDADDVDPVKYSFLQQIYSWMGQMDSVLFATEEDIINWMLNPKTYLNTKPSFMLNTRQQITLDMACGGLQPTYCDYPNDRSSMEICVLPDPVLHNVTCPTEYPNIRNESCGDGMCVPGLDDCTCVDCAACRDNWPGYIYYEPYFESETNVCGNVVFGNNVTENAMNFLISLRIFWGTLDKVIGAKIVQFDNITEGCITENWRLKPYLMSVFSPLTNYSTIKICVNKTNLDLFEDDFVQLGIEIVAPLMNSSITMINYTAGCGNGVCAEGEHNLCNSDCFIPFSALNSERIIALIIGIIVVVLI